MNESILVPRDFRLTDEAYSVLLGMVEHCLNTRVCMGMDEGFKSFDPDEEHDFVKEFRALLAQRASALKPVDSAPVLNREFRKILQDHGIVTESIGGNRIVQAIEKSLAQYMAAHPVPAVTVKLPDRKNRRDQYGYLYPDDRIWNACIDATIALNKPEQKP